MFKFIETLLVALTGGFVFHLLYLPLPWLLGSLTATMIWHLVAKRNPFWPLELRNFGLIILGFMLGSSFTVETGLQIIKQLPAMIFATTSTVLFSLLVGYITHRRTGISLTTGIIGSIPGGLTQMVVLSEEIADTDLTVVTFMQTLRLLSTVFIIPFIVIHGLTGYGQQAVATNMPEIYNFAVPAPWNALLFTGVVLFATWVAVRIKLPTAFLLGPLIGAAALVLCGLSAPEPPSFLIIISQLCIGTYLGRTIDPASFENRKNLLPYALGGSVAVVFFCLGVGAFLTRLHSLDLVSAFLGTSPGGMGEMGLTAVLVGANISLVAAYQMFRLLFVLFIIPFLLKWRFGSVPSKNKGTS